MTDLTCPECNHHVSPADHYCQTCGYPLLGTDEQQQEFRYNRGAKTLELSSLQAKIKSASTSLFVLLGLAVVGGIIFYFMDPAGTGMVILIVQIIVAAIYLALGFWAKVKPVPALIAGLSLFVVIILAGAIEDPKTIFSGIIIKGLIIFYLIKGLRSAFEAEKIKKQLNTN